MRTVIAPGVLALVLLTEASLALAGHEVNRWNLATAPDFTQAFVRTECPGQIPCQEDDFSIGGSSGSGCFNGQDTVPRLCVGQAVSDSPWSASGASGYLPLAGDTIVESETSIEGQRLSASVFEVSVKHHPAFNFVGPSEVAVLRFTGDPNDFDGVEADSVADLIGLGLIGAGDVLAVESGIQADVDFQADVTGVPDEEIVVFGAGSGPIPELIPGFTVLASPSFTYCFAHSESFFDNPPFPPLDQCSDYDLQPQFSNCQVDCPTIEADSDAAGDESWAASGSTTWTIPLFPEGASTTTATLSAQLFVDSQGGSLLTVEQHHDNPAVKPQVAVIRFDGDPGVFEGLSPFDVSRLVHDGIIQPEDVFYVKNFTPADPVNFETNVPLPNVGPSQVVLFISARTLWGYETDANDVPATSPVGLVVLALVLLGLGRVAATRYAR